MLIKFFGIKFGEALLRGLLYFTRYFAKQNILQVIVVSFFDLVYVIMITILTRNSQFSLFGRQAYLSLVSGES